MKPCVIIPVFNHAAALPEVVRGAQAHCPVIVVDDGSTDDPVIPADVTLIRFAQNRGKAAALRAGFAKAAELGFTHAITMDADGQHFAEDVPAFLAEAERQPGALLVGVRDFVAAGAPAGRRRANAISRFWFHVATGVRLGDAQCGFRCYPLGPFLKLRIGSERYAFELESLIRAAWTGMPVLAVPVRVRYEPELVRGSHFRPVADIVKITNLQIRLVLQAWFVPAELRRTWSLGGHESFQAALRDVFSENAQEPERVAGAVGLGLFCGIAPIWGFQLLVALALAHRWRLNKAITALASNISIPPVTPFFIYGSLLLGHWMFTDDVLDVAPKDMTMARALEYGGQWFAGSLVLAVIVAVPGMLVAYGITRLVRRK
ncbi:MAG: DUF2062 domain-containing protein [Verrucomicrobiota bacterium]